MERFTWWGFDFDSLDKVELLSREIFLLFKREEDVQISDEDLARYKLPDWITDKKKGS